MVKIRKAEKKDLKELVLILKIESAKKPYNQKWNNKTALNKLNYSFKREEIFIISNENILGFAICKTNKFEKDARLDEIWIKSEYQGKGNGRKLLKFLEEFYSKKGFRYMSLVADKRSKAFGFYKKLNFKENKSVVFMEKKLK